LELSLSTRCPLEIVDGGDVRARIALRAGETAAFVLDRVEPGEMPAPCSDADIAREFDTTVAFWRGWLEGRFRYAADRESGPLQIMYGIDGREDLPEEELTHLEGYMGSAPVRIGNRAATQLQLDIYGEVMDALYLCNKYGPPIYHDGWIDLTRNLEWLMDHWDQPDEGIWETRGGRQDYTYSRVMSWVAVERAIRIARQRGLPADLSRWTAVRDNIYKQLMERGWHPGRRAFVQHYDTDVLDASLLIMPMCKIIAPTDPRWISTLDAILTVLLRVGGGARPRRPSRRGPPGLREDAQLREPRRAVLRGDRAHGRATRQLPAGLHAPRVDQRRLQPGPRARVSVGDGGPTGKPVGGHRRGSLPPRRRRDHAGHS